MTHCAKCQKDVHPVQEMQADMRVVDVCPSCTGALQAVAPAVAAVIPLRKAPTPTPPHSPEPQDLLSLTRARVVALRGEVAALEAKRSELAMYERMLIAANESEDAILVQAEYVRAPHQMNGTH
jgi:hypothetical protein